jgi:hypothetical protein
MLAVAGEREGWEPEAEHRRREMEEMADGAILGHVRGEERAEVERYWDTHLRRVPMDAIAAAHYSIAEIQLRKENPKAAAAALAKLLDGEPDPELASATRFSLGEIARRHLKDPEAAAKHYTRVQGLYRHHARHYLLAMLADAGRAAEAAQLLEGLAAKAQEKGEKLALLQQLAAFCRRAGMEDRALEAYGRITEEFTPADLAKLREAAAAEAEALVDRMRALAQAERGHEVERLERQIHQRARDLRLAGRAEEFQAFTAALERRFQQFDQEREDRERREEGHGRPERPEEF